MIWRITWGLWGLCDFAERLSKLKSQLSMLEKQVPGAQSPGEIEAPPASASSTCADGFAANDWQRDQGGDEQRKGSRFRCYEWVVGTRACGDSIIGNQQIGRASCR